MHIPSPDRRIYTERVCERECERESEGKRAASLLLSLSILRPCTFILSNVMVSYTINSYIYYVYYVCEWLLRLGTYSVRCYYLSCDYYIVLSFFVVGPEEHRKNRHDDPTTGPTITDALVRKRRFCFCDTKPTAFSRCVRVNQYRSTTRRIHCCIGTYSTYLHTGYSIRWIVIIKCNSTQLIFDRIKGPLPYYAIMYIHNVRNDDASSLFVIRSNAHSYVHIYGMYAKM